MSSFEHESDRTLSQPPTTKKPTIPSNLKRTPGTKAPPSEISNKTLKKTEATPEENKTDDLGKSEVSVEENLIIQPDENLVNGTANEMHAETNGLNSDAELQKT